MKYSRLLIILIIGVALSSTAFAEKRNLGYAETDGFIGLFGGNVIHEGEKEGATADVLGVMAYYNLFNREWGNLAIGTQIMPQTGKIRKENEYSLDYDIMPLELNLAYMTASDLFNLWFGAGVSYNAVNAKFTGITVADSSGAGEYGTCKLSPESVSEYSPGYQLFFGAERLFGKTGTWGVFVQGRYQFSKELDIETNQTVSCAGVNTSNAPVTINRSVAVKDTLSPTNSSYIIGVSYHF